MKRFLLSTTLILVILMAAAYFLNELTKSRNFQFFGELVNKVETTEKVVALTFDDGPAENTRSILDILRYENTRATFFLTGYEMEKNMDGTKKIVQEGHEIGNHSYSHRRMIFKSPTFIRDEIERADQLIRQAGYRGEIHFRPPTPENSFSSPIISKARGGRPSCGAWSPIPIPRLPGIRGKSWSTSWKTWSPAPSSCST